MTINFSPLQVLEHINVGKTAWSTFMPALKCFQNFVLKLSLLCTSHCLQLEIQSPQEESVKNHTEIYNVDFQWHSTWKSNVCSAQPTGVYGFEWLLRWWCYWWWRDTH